jgi:hypothetical protein
MIKFQLLQRLTDIEWDDFEVKLAENAGYGFEKMLQWEKFTNTKLVFLKEIDRSVVTFDIEKISDISYINNLNENVTENTEKVGEK